MVKLIMRFISDKDERFTDYKSYARKYYKVEYIWWLVHRILFFITSVYASYYACIKYYIIDYFLWWLLAILYFICSVSYIFCRANKKWIDIRPYVRGRRY